MKQSVIDQMKEYQSKRKTVKAIQYREGMEDGWIILLPDMPDGNDFIKKVFNSKDEAKQYTTTPAFCNHEYGVFNIIPVILTILADDEVEYYSHVVSINMIEYAFEEIDSDDMWIGIDENGTRRLYYDLLDDYEEISVDTHQAKIGYDSDLGRVYVDFESRRINLDRSEVATVEKILEGLEIPYTEKLGELLKWDE